MELEGLKSAWQKQFAGADPLLSPAHLSRSLQLLRTSTIRDLQGSDEWARLIFSFLFALAAVGASFAVMPAGGSRIVAWLFATALIVDGVVGVTLLVRREPATPSMLDFISRERRHVDTRIRFERYSQGVMLVLAGAALALVVFGPTPKTSFLDTASDGLWKMIVATAFLAVAWRRVRARSHSAEIRRELDSFLKDLSE